MTQVTVTAELLKQLMPYAGRRAEVYAEPLTAAMAEWHVNTPKRVAAFLAQCAHESGSLAFVLEIASGRDYENRHDLGNTQPGDGVKYKGRGLLQLTGRLNYERYSGAAGTNFVQYPQLLEQPRDACRSAAWFWNVEGLNEQADKERFGAITRRINGGYTGLDDRIEHWLRMRKLLGL